MYNTRRLLTLADALETRIPADKFDLAYWRSSNSNAFRDVTDDALRNTCCTTGCAVGWACALPEFNAEGLHWDVIEQQVAYTEVAFDSSKDGNYSWQSALQFFGLNEDEGTFLFLDTAYTDDEGYALPGLPRDEFGNPKLRPAHVAQRIRHLLAGGTPFNHSFEVTGS